MRSSQPPLDYLVTCSQSSLEGFELARLDQISRLRAEVGQIQEEWIEAEVAARLARLILQGRHLESPCVAPSPLLGPPLENRQALSAAQRPPKALRPSRFAASLLPRAYPERGDQPDSVSAEIASSRASPTCTALQEAPQPPPEALSAAGARTSHSDLWVERHPRACGPRFLLALSASRIGTRQRKLMQGPTGLADASVIGIPESPQLPLFEATMGREWNGFRNTAAREAGLAARMSATDFGARISNPPARSLGDVFCLGQETLRIWRLPETGLHCDHLANREHSRPRASVSPFGIPLGFSLPHSRGMSLPLAQNPERYETSSTTSVRLLPIGLDCQWPFRISQARFAERISFECSLPSHGRVDISHLRSLSSFHLDFGLSTSMN